MWYVNKDYIFIHQTYRITLIILWNSWKICHVEIHSWCCAWLCKFIPTWCWPRVFTRLQRVLVKSPRNPCSNFTQHERERKLPGLWHSGSFICNKNHMIEHVSFGLLYVMFTFPTTIFYRGVPGFATDCPCGVWCRGLTTCPLYVGPLFGNLV